MSKTVKPVTLTDKDNGKVYTLEFSRDSVRFAEKNGFDLDNLKPLTGVEDLFYYSFRMHHKFISREEAMKILYEKLGGLPDGLVDRLLELYTVPFNALSSGDEGGEKNSTMVVEL